VRLVRNGYYPLINQNGLEGGILFKYANTSAIERKFKGMNTQEKIVVMGENEIDRKKRNPGRNLRYNSLSG